MADHDIENLLEESFSGDPPAPAFRAGALRDSLAAFDQGRKSHVRRRWARFGLAAAFIAGASFLMGRYLAPRSVTLLRPEPVAAAPAGTVTVSRELVAWLEAANLFRRLGMEERMTRALERAGQQRAYPSAWAGSSDQSRPATTNSRIVEEIEKPAGLSVLSRLYELPQSTEGIMATSLGGRSHASAND